MRKVAKKVISKALRAASRMNDLANTYDYDHGPPPPGIAPEIRRLQEELIDLWLTLTVDEMTEYKRRYRALPNSPHAPKN